MQTLALISIKFPLAASWYNRKVKVIRINKLIPNEKFPNTLFSVFKQNLVLREKLQECLSRLGENNVPEVHYYSVLVQSIIHVMHVHCIYM